MADEDFQRLFVSLEARFNRFERDLAKAQRQTNTTFNAIQARGRTFERNLTSGFNRVGAGLTGAFAGAVSIRAATQLIDASTRITNALKVAGLEGEELSATYDELFKSAQRNAAPLEGLVELYGRARQVQNELNVSNEELLGFSDKIAVALRVSGKSASEASGALLQLSQALGSGIVRAEEFNSINEGAQPILQAVAAGLEEAGGSVSKLRQLVIDGKVSSEAFFRAFEAGSVILEDRVAGAELTVSQRFVRLQNVLIDTAGKFDDASGAGEGIAMVLDQITSEVEQFGEWYATEGPQIVQFFADIANAMDAIQNWGVDFGQSTGLSGIGRWIEDVTGLEVSIDYAEQGLNRLERAAVSADERIGDAENAVRAFVETFLDANDVPGFEEPIRQSFEQIVEDLNTGQFEAEETLAALEAMGEANPSFARVLDGLAQVIVQLMNVTSAARVAHAAAAGAVIARPWRREEIEGPAIPTTTTTTTTPVSTVSLSDYKLPGSGGTGGSGGRTARAAAVDKERESVERLIESMRTEIDLTGLSGNQKRAEEVLRSAGATATDQQRAEIYRLVEALDAKEQALERVQDAMRTATDLGQQFGRSIVSDLMAGKSASEALQNALTDLASQLLKMAMDQAIAGIVGALFGAFNPLGGGGNFTPSGFVPGGYYPGIAASTGGYITGAGTGTSDSIPARLSNGEYVINADATRRNRALLEMINNGARGFANGGIAGRSVSPVMDTAKLEVATKFELINEGPPMQSRDGGSRSQGGMDIKRIIVSPVKSAFADGTMDELMQQLYGLKRRGV